jgi:hypothetical protein
MTRARKGLAAALLLAAVGFIAFDWGRFTSDFWPPDRSFVGPNLVAALVQAVFILIVITLVYPPTRRAVERFITGHFHEAHEKLKNEVDVLHQCLDHIITHHPDIPEFHAERRPPDDTPDTASDPKV